MRKIFDYRSESAMDNDTIRYYAPSIFAQRARGDRSDRYGYIPTGSVLEKMLDAGFVVHQVAQQRCNIVENREYARHMIRMYHPDMPDTAEGRYEIIMMNSHDGTSAFRLSAGFFRFVCANGLWIGQKDADVKVYHRGSNIAQDVIEGSFRVIADCRKSAELVEDMRTRCMGIAHRIAFAEQAVKLRFGDKAVITTEQALRTIRHDDQADTQWNVFNRVQENIVKGGMYGRSANGKERKVRQLNGLTKTATFNSELWELMQKIREGMETETA